MAVCYRHPNRETGVSCSNCGKPICPDCMTATPVGMRCPDCSRQRTPVRTLRNVYAEPTATYVLIGINVVLWLGTLLSGGNTSSVYIDLATLGSGTLNTGEQIGVAHGDVWRLVMLEPVLGHVRFVSLYFASLLAGSFGALLAEPHQFTVGASGAVFGLMAAAFIFQRARGVDPWRSGLGPVILLNLALPFLFPGLNISIGAHVGGLIGGAIAALAIERLGAIRKGDLLPVLACVAVGAVSVVGALSVASG
jgi:hypothetical protein